MANLFEDDFTGDDDDSLSDYWYPIPHVDGQPSQTWDSNPTIQSNAACDTVGDTLVYDMRSTTSLIFPISPAGEDFVLQFDFQCNITDQMEGGTFGCEISDGLDRGPNLVNLSFRYHSGRPGSGYHIFRVRTGPSLPTNIVYGVDDSANPAAGQFKIEKVGDYIKTYYNLDQSDVFIPLFSDLYVAGWGTDPLYFHLNSYVIYNESNYTTVGCWDNFVLNGSAVVPVLYYQDTYQFTNPVPVGTGDRFANVRYNDGGDTWYQVIDHRIQDTAWDILNTNIQDIAWDILNTNVQDTAWDILTESSQDTAWDILNTITQDTSWAILNANTQGVAWDILNHSNQDISWSTLKGFSQETSWTIFPTILRYIQKFYAKEVDYTFTIANPVPWNFSVKKPLVFDFVPTKVIKTTMTVPTPVNETISIKEPVTFTFSVKQKINFTIGVDGDFDTGFDENTD